MKNSSLSDAAAQASSQDALLASDVLRWRCIGPPRGGRVVAVAGDPVDPMTFYFGACAGGIWKTTDGGTYWECVSDGFLKTASVGALTVAPSDPNVIYAGMGETTIRIDVSWGDGVYKSTDAGRTWRHMGLSETRHIGEIRVHPTDPDTVYVAALGHAFGANAERGVYRSRDGGETWELILHESDRAGAVDIAMDPTNPRILFAAIWEAHRHFWTLSSGGDGSKLYRSTDGGDTWEEVSRNPGFAPGLLGKIGVSLAPKAGRVYALVEAKDEAAGLYRSEDYGATWTQVSPNRDLIHRPWYYTHVFADPVDADTVYVTNYQMWKSTDGGRDFHEVTTPHGDNHDIWIDPQNPRRMVEGNDGGACVSFNGGRTWSTIYNQMTAQFYRMDVDDQFPYRVYATQQDNTSISVPSATEWGVITMGDCILPGTGESGFIAVHPDDANVVFIGAVGSSPGGSGALQRYDHRTRQTKLVNVWPEEQTGIAPKDLKYRFAWTFPILFSPHDSGVLYAGGNHVFRSTDEGMSWEEISPDLSRADESKLGYSGGPLTGDSAGAETYATLATLVESPHRPGELWAGTDDGRVHVRRGADAAWEEVRPAELPELAYVATLEVSPHDADTVYLAATCFKSDDYAPYLFVTRDGGQSWSSLSATFPGDEITRVIRCDPERAGLLFVGTETGVFGSLNDGLSWTRLTGGLPVVPVYDLRVKHGDLVAATHGRAFWILDDLAALRQAAAETALFAPKPTPRLTLTWGTGVFDGDGVNYSPAFGVEGAYYDVEHPDERAERRYLDVGQNPPRGVILAYWLAAEPEAPISLTIRDQAGEVLRAFSSEAEMPADRLPAKVGLNRFVWNGGTAAPTALDPALVERKYEPFAKSKEGGGPTVPPGDYSVTLEVEGQELSAVAQILPDPRLAADAEAFAAQFALSRRLVASRDSLRRTVNGIRRMRRQIRALSVQAAGLTNGLAGEAEALLDRLGAIEGALVDVHRETPRDVLRNPARHDDTLGDLLWTVGMADARPPSQVEAVAEEVMAAVAAEVAAYDAILADDVPALNAKVRAADIPAIRP
ncbi:MAG: glycosyl hydrolase [Pseudomonadota bacterium]